MILKAEQLNADLIACGLPPWCPQFNADNTFACPTLSSAKKVFASYWQDRAARGLSYSRRHDCDDFARGAAQYFSDAHALTQLDPNIPETYADTSACFEVWYQRSDGTSHAINLVRTIDSGVIFMEPQNAQELSLADSEKSTIRFRR